MTIATAWSDRRLSIPVGRNYPADKFRSFRFAIMQRSSLSLFFPSVPVPFARSLGERRRRRRPGVERNFQSWVSVGELKDWNVEILQDFCLGFERVERGMKLEQGIGLGIRESKVFLVLLLRFEILRN